MTAYGHVWELLPKCVNHPTVRATFVLESGDQACGACVMPEVLATTPASH